jgi:Ser/Thr protein kinase RdoA (MazF antagonist)
VISSPPPNLAAVAAAFAIEGEFRSGEPYGSGHINDTFRISCGARYILQRINQRVFKRVPELMENVARVTEHIRRRSVGPQSRALTLVRTRDGRAYHIDEAGEPWRCYAFIEAARTYDVIESPRQASEAARMFGEFQRMLADLPGARLHETIPHFHHTRQRFDTLQRAIQLDSHQRAAQAADLIAFARERESMVDVLLGLQARGEIVERVTHNDTKLNNVMLDDVTGAGVCVLDLDTVMPGLALYDFGDMVRSATNSAPEDEPDPARVQCRLPIFTALVEGYLSSAGAFLNPAELAHLTFSGRLITLEIGMRFLTDFLQGDVYFKTRRPTHNLDRARNQFALVQSMELQEREMDKIVESASKTR